MNEFQKEQLQVMLRYWTKTRRESRHLWESTASRILSTLMKVVDGTYTLDEFESVLKENFDNTDGVMIVSSYYDRALKQVRAIKSELHIAGIE